MPINATLRRLRELPGAERIVFGLDVNKNGNPIDDPDKAVIVPRSVLKEGHIHIRGRTRSGKTALAIAPLLQQLIRPYPYRDPSGQVLVPNMQDPIFIFDLGGDLSLFNFVSEALCTQRYEDEKGNLIASPRTFRFLSLKQGDDWHYFDPFQIVPDGERDLIRLAQVLIEAFNQDYGLLYGASYYSMRSLSALLRVANHVVSRSQGGKNLDFYEVGQYFERNNKFDRDEAQIKMAFQFLMTYEQLRRPPPTAPQDRQINWRQALDNSEVVYFFCPSMGQATTARQVAGLGLYTLLATAQLRKDSGANEGEGHRHAWVIVDEFQELAGRSFASLLAQSSKFGISLILANQTTTQLETRDVNLANVVRDNTLAKIYFTVTGKQDFDDLQSFSLEGRDELRSLQQTENTGIPTSTSYGISERLTTNLRRDEILSTSSKSKNFFLILDDGSGNCEPKRLFTDYTITPEEYHRFRNQPISKRDPPPSGNGEPRTPVATTTPTQQAPPRPGSPAKTKRNEALLNLLEEKQRQEQPDYVKQHYSSRT